MTCSLGGCSVQDLSFNPLRVSSFMGLGLGLEVEDSEVGFKPLFSSFVLLYLV